MDIDEQFMKAQLILRSKQTPSKEDDLLLLYGLYKQATQGDCVVEQPWCCQKEAYSKWEAWFKKRGMDRNTAKQKYIDKVNEMTNT